jgi:hypothetical protein
MESNFIMKAFKRKKKKDAGLSSSESSVDEDNYQKQIMKLSRKDSILEVG